MHVNSITAAKLVSNGAADNRNLDLVHAKHALYQLSYNPTQFWSKLLKIAIYINMPLKVNNWY